MGGTRSPGSRISGPPPPSPPPASSPSAPRDQSEDDNSNLSPISSLGESPLLLPPPPPPPPLLSPPPVVNRHNHNNHSPRPKPARLSPLPRLPFRFDTGYALFAKRAPRPFPPPFLSPPSGSFSDPLSTHDRSRAVVAHTSVRGRTNGDDAVFASPYFICATDGVGAWSARPRGHAGLWSRLILHFWATNLLEDASRQGAAYVPDTVSYLQRAYEQTLEATSAPNDWKGTTTATGAQLHYRPREKQRSKDGESEEAASFLPTELSGGRAADEAPGEEGGTELGSREDPGHSPSTTAPPPHPGSEPLLYVTNLGDSQVMVVRPSARALVYKSEEQWHWFDCPRQLGTNSPDEPRRDAAVDAVPVREGDVVLAMSDGVIDNLWPYEIVDKVCDSVERWAREGDRLRAERAGRWGARRSEEEEEEEEEVGEGEWADGNAGENHGAQAQGQDTAAGKAGGNGEEGADGVVVDAGDAGVDGGRSVRHGNTRTAARRPAAQQDDDSLMMMAFVAEGVMEAAKTVAMDPFAESPYMERAIDEGLASEGGKMDDISVVAAICRRND